MGLFDAIADAFKKKECSICGGEIGLLGNRKLEDGNMCKKCAAKLSPWFDDRRHSTVVEIEEQLKYREENRRKVAEFRTTRTLGEYTKVLLDEDSRRFMVSSSRDLEEENPDVLDFSDVTGCTLDIDEHRDEIKYENEEGQQVSYNPPRYTYEYDFYMVINVRHKYFDDMRFKLNRSRVEIDNFHSQRTRPGGFGGGFFGGGMQQIMNPEHDVEYSNYKAMGEEIKQVLMQVRQQARDDISAGVAPKRIVNCPFCGASVTPNAAGCCDFCGGAIS